MKVSPFGNRRETSVVSFGNDNEIYRGYDELRMINDSWRNPGLINNVRDKVGELKSRGRKTATADRNL